MPLDLPRRLLERAQQYLRTAEAAHGNNDHDAAFENARSAAELAAKAMLEAAGVGYGQDHNVAGALVNADCWPRSKGKALSRFLAEYVRGVYGFTSPVRPKDANDAIRMAGQVCKTAADRIGET